MTRPVCEADCPCYGCTIARQRAGIAVPDRSGEPCSPPDACATHGRCWTHSEWFDARGDGEVVR